MKIVTITWAKNEIDIIEAFVRHTAYKADALIVLDNGSTGGTDEVLSGLRNEGLPLAVPSDPAPGYYRAERMTAILQEYGGKENADWIASRKHGRI